MATTAGGLPYPLGTDFLVNGDDSVKDLADALQARGHGMRIEIGKRAVTTVGPDGQASFLWTTQFTGPPVPTLSAGWPLTVASFKSDIPPDAAGVTFVVRYAFNNDAFVGNCDIWYIAIGPK